MSIQSEDEVVTNNDANSIVSSVLMLFLGFPVIVGVVIGFVYLFTMILFHVALPIISGVMYILSNIFHLFS